MPKLIKNKTLQRNEWCIIKDGTEISANLSKKLFLTFDLWSNLNDQLEQKLANSELGLFIDSHQSCDDLPEDFELAEAIAINFPVFTDGRGYSIAKDLRTLKNYKGEVRAVGEVLHDQLNAMMRCGFDAFELVDDVDETKAIAAFNEWSEKYQADLLEKRPIYMR